MIEPKPQLRIYAYDGMQSSRELVVTVCVHDLLLTGSGGVRFDSMEDATKTDHDSDLFAIISGLLGSDDPDLVGLWRVLAAGSRLSVLIRRPERGAAKATIQAFAASLSDRYEGSSELMSTVNLWIRPKSRLED